jgi:hypothetical protein
MIKAYRLALVIAVGTAATACGHESAPVAASSPAASTGAVSDVQPLTVAPRAAPVRLQENDLVEIAVGEGQNQPVPLSAGQVAKGIFIAPRPGQVLAIDVQLGTYANTSDGMLKVKLCKDEVCRTGTGDILSSLDNEYFSILLDQPLSVAAGDSLSYKFTKEGGVVVVALWGYPRSAGDTANMSVDNGKLLDLTPKLALRYAK